MEEVGRILLITGLAIAALGACLMLASRAPGLGLGRLPGDIAVHRPGFSFYFPVTTMLLLSAAATIVFWLVSRVRR